MEQQYGLCGIEPQSRFSFATQRLFGEDLPLRQNGFVSATEMISALIDTFHLEPVNDENGQQWTIMDIPHSDLKQSGVIITVITSVCMLSEERKQSILF